MNQEPIDLSSSLLYLTQNVVTHWNPSWAQATSAPLCVK